MAIKAGQIIHVANDEVVIDRIQTAGPGTVSVPVETVYELGDYKSVGQVRDIPDLSFALESYDVSCSLEALLLGVDPEAVHSFDFGSAQPVDMKSAFKAGQQATDPFAIVDSVGIPYLTLESMAYSFGLTTDAKQTATLKGDSIYYNPGSTYVEKTAGTNTANQTVATTNPAYAVTEAGVTRRILSISAGGKRLVFGIDYTEAYGSITDGAAITTLTVLAAVPTTSSINIMYSSPTAEEYPQNVNAVVSVIKPAAIRGRDIAVYLGAYDPANPFTNRIDGVQSFDCTWKVTLQKDQEFGNYHLVAQDYDVPDVSGTIEVKPVDPQALVAVVQKITGVDPTSFESATATSSPIVPITCVLHSPLDGSVLKVITVDDARWTAPGFSGQVQQKLSVKLAFTSDRGDLLVSDGSRVVTDGVTTTASPDISSATANFVPDDEGHPITGVGIPAGTTILSVTSGTAAVLSADATATGAGVTFTIG